ncbi:MAG: hypothetical protein QOE65_2689 [Solirubrobacteraceae bacterium]|jgi:hypothetical protein|nr:hypothetical protein [Solirubrobacteraceae bacterium]
MEAVRRHPGAAAFVLFAGLSFLFFGLRVTDHPGSELIATEEIEPSQYVWALEWWPHALLHGDNPFHTGAIFAPAGYNLAWAPASIPGPSLLLAPLTLAAGPMVAYNALALLCPAVAAWSAFLLCRHLTGSTAAALAGGYLFGFSAPVLANLQGVPNLAFVGLLPLLALLVVRHAGGSLSTRAFVPLTATVLALQFLTSNELLVQALLAAALGLALTALLMPQRRHALRATAVAALGAGALAALAVSPWLWWMLFEPHLDPHHAQPQHYSADLLSYVFPTGLHRLGRTWFAPVAATFGGEGGGFGAGGRAYLGLPLLAIVAAFTVGEWRRPGTRLLFALLAVLALAALGPKLVVAGLPTMPLPWRAATEMPYLKWAKPGHIATLTALGAAVVAALWVARRPSVARWALVGAAVAFLFPNLGSARWHTAVAQPAFFAGHRDRTALSPRDRVFVVPFVGANMRWQAQTGIRWQLTGGYVGEVPRDFDRLYGRVGTALVRRTPANLAVVRGELTRRGVTAIVVPDYLPDAWRILFDAVAGRPGRGLYGVTVWRLRAR